MVYPVKSILPQKRFIKCCAEDDLILDETRYSDSVEAGRMAQIHGDPGR